LHLPHVVVAAAFVLLWNRKTSSLLLLLFDYYYSVRRSVDVWIRSWHIRTRGIGDCYGVLLLLLKLLLLLLAWMKSWNVLFAPHECNRLFADCVHAEHLMMTMLIVWAEGILKEAVSLYCYFCSHCP
jgi:hypothetical protein